MKELKALVEYASPVRLRRLTFIKTRTKSSKTNIGKLYKGIADGELHSDEEASIQLFGKSSDARFYKLKHSLREQLINTVLLIENRSDRNGDPYRDFIELRKQLYVGEVLWKKGNPFVANDILERTLKRAIRYDMTELIVAALPMLRSFVFTYSPDQKKYDEYNLLAKKWSTIYLAEVDIRNIYDDLVSSYVFKTKTPLQIAKQARIQLAEHKTRFHDISTVEYTYFIHFIQVIEKLNENKFQEAIQISWKAIEVLRNRDFTPRAYIRLFLLQVIASTLRFEGFLEGRRAVIEYLKIVTEGDPPWFRIYQMYLYLCIQSREFPTAVSVTNKIFKHKKFKRLPDVYKEIWHLLRAYLAWIIDTGNTGVLEGEELHQFRVARFVNQVPGFSKDKQGMNLAVLIIQCLWLTHQKKYAAARNRFESLDRYCGRHIRNAPGLQRAYYFVKVITQLPKADFHKEAFVRKAARFFAKLQQHDRPQDQQTFEVEIVPYEHLYHYLLSILDDKIH